MTELGPEQLLDIFSSALQLIRIRREGLRRRHRSVSSTRNANLRSPLKKQTSRAVHEHELEFKKQSEAQKSEIERSVT